MSEAARGREGWETVAGGKKSSYPKYAATRTARDEKGVERRGGRRRSTLHTQLRSVNRRKLLGSGSRQQKYTSS